MPKIKFHQTVVFLSCAAINFSSCIDMDSQLFYETVLVVGRWDAVSLGVVNKESLKKIFGVKDVLDSKNIMQKGASFEILPQIYERIDAQRQNCCSKVSDFTRALFGPQARRSCQYGPILLLLKANERCLCGSIIKAPAKCL